MRYEIDENNAISVYAEGESVPFLWQPHYPNLTPFPDRAAAELWATQYLAYFADPENVAFPEEPAL